MSSRAQRAMVWTWMRWSVLEGSGVGIGQDGWMRRILVGASKMRAFMVGGRVGVVDVVAMDALGMLCANLNRNCLRIKEGLMSFLPTIWRGYKGMMDPSMQTDYPFCFVTSGIAFGLSEV